MPGMLIVGYSEASMALRGRAAPVGALISICGTGEFGMGTPPAVPVLRLSFDDVDAEDPDDQVGRLRAWARRRAEAETGRMLRPPAAEDARAIVEFARSIRTIESRDVSMRRRHEPLRGGRPDLPGHVGRGGGGGEMPGRTASGEARRSAASRTAEVGRRRAREERCAASRRDERAIA